MDPVQRIVQAFGGTTQLCRAMAAIGVHLHRTTVYRWHYPRHLGGRGGRIPIHRIEQIKKAGRYAGVAITEDMFVKDA